MAIYNILDHGSAVWVRTEGDKVVQPTLALLISNVFAIISAFCNQYGQSWP